MPDLRYLALVLIGLGIVSVALGWAVSLSEGWQDMVKRKWK